MSKKKFLKKLDYYLLTLDSSERQKFVGYYEEILDDYMESGLSEEEAVAKVGNPKQITEKILGENAEFGMGSGKCVHSTLFGILYFMIWGIGVFVFYIVAVSLFLSIFMLAVLAAATAAVSVIGFPFVAASESDILVGIMQLGIGIACAGLAVLSSRLLLVCCTKVPWLFKRTGRRAALILRGTRL